jgi:hypothetical protein
MSTPALNDGYHVEVDQVTKEEWSELLLRFDDATIYQTWSYGACAGEKINSLVLKKVRSVSSTITYRKLSLLEQARYLFEPPLATREKKIRNTRPNLQGLTKNVYFRASSLAENSSQ